MDKAIVADNKPIKVELDGSEQYFYCRCGRSAAQPFCDGSHKGTSITPLKFSPEDSGAAFLCMCKHSKNLPYCDGSHKAFSDDQVGKAAD